MKVNLSTVDIGGRNCGGGLDSSRESQPARVDRMKAFWARPENATIYRVGRVLANQADATRSIAEVLAGGEDVELEAVTIEGKVLPLQEGFTLSLAKLPQAWGCPACHSAHGSGVWPSTSVNAGNLETCEFYYNPQTRLLFTISKTCWRDYVEKLGVVSRFVGVPLSIEMKVAETETRIESDIVSEGVTNRLASAFRRDAPTLQLLNNAPVPVAKAGHPPPATPGELREIANAGLYTKGLAKQASAALPGLLNRFESYQKECARQEFGSCLLMAGKEPPFILDQIRCREWNDAENALRDYFTKYRRVVDPADLRRTVANHFRGLGFRVNLIPDPHQVRISHLGWLFRWFMPRDTVQVIW